MRILADGREILLGKTFAMEGQRIFYHEGKNEEWFYDLNSPYGIDQDVAGWLQLMDVDVIHHYVKETDKLYACRVPDLMEYGILHSLREVSRLYLPAPLWEIMDGRSYGRPWINDVVYFADWAQPGLPAGDGSLEAPFAPDLYRVPQMNNAGA